MYAVAPEPYEHLESAKHLLDGLRLAGVGVWRWKVDSDFLLWTDNLTEVHGAPASRYDATLDSFKRDVHPDDLDDVWRAISISVQTGEPYSFIYRTNPKVTDQVRWIETRGGLVLDENGEKWLTGACMDVTTRVRAEMQLTRRLRQQRALEELGSFALGEESLQAVADRAVRVAADVLEVPLAKILQLTNSGEELVLLSGIGWRRGSEGHEHVSNNASTMAGFTLQEGRPVIVSNLALETRFSGPQLLHDHCVISGMSTVIAGSDERPFGVFSVYATTARAFDPADAEFLNALAHIVANSARQIAATEHRMLLVREMAHRAGNMLQLVNTLAHRTFTPNHDLAKAHRIFAERLGSLSRSNFLIAKGGWTMTQFASLAREVLEPFRDRVDMRGRDVLLPPELCFDLGLILHELSTNAVKYGTLKNVEGAVELSWRIERDAEAKEYFLMEWSDALSKGMEPCTQTRGTGFGSKLISLLVEQKWGGMTCTDSENGYRFSCRVPLNNTEPARNSLGGQAA
ncbi:sensor histidine kinase [Nitratireductor basaltis]|uniref:Blue-light-activated histidine kinase n=1 Tax=Nitratireductor basaltis TaxID=472175 RepID=A0A084U818_9HYPH|nr:HWE histidine kinase domain-containing protein [Nitratireductor basaltis]KFB09104.1 Signal transduction histidine kinase [Nitratireductor basaltis]